MTGRVVLRDAEADRAEAVLARADEQPAQELVAVATAAPARDNSDRELRRLLVDEAEAGVLLREQAVPGRADRHELVEHDQGAVAGATPAVDVTGQRRLLITDRSPPIEGVAEHVAEKRDVARAASPDHGTSLRLSGNLFGKLDAIAVRVVDVEQPHLSMELEDRSDLDPLGAEAVGFGLDVTNVHGRDAGLLLRLALRDRDLHLSAQQPRPAAFLVHVGLHEAELVDVEGAACVEVAHVVPDLNRVHSIRPGSSRK